MDEVRAIHFPSGENWALDCKLGFPLVSPKGWLASFPSRSTTQISEAPFTNLSQSRYLPSGDQSVGELMSDVSSTTLAAPEPLEGFRFSVKRFPTRPTE